MPPDPVLIRLRDERDELKEALRQANAELRLRSARLKELEPKEGQWTIWGDLLWWGHQVVPLSKKEYIIVELLFSHKGRVVTKERIYSAMYATESEGDSPDIKILDVMVCKARGKIRKSGGPCYLKTIWGRGYSWTEGTKLPAGEIEQLIHEVSETST